MYTCQTIKDERWMVTDSNDLPSQVCMNTDQIL